MIGDIARQLNATMQAIMDAAHLANAPGGLIGKAMRIGRGEQGDKLKVQGNRLQYVNTTGGSIRDSVYQWQFPGPSSMMMDLFGALRDAALRGLGLVQLPDFYVEEDLAVGALIEVLTQFREQREGIWALYPQNRNLSPKVRLLIDFLVEKLSDSPANP